MGFIHSIVQQVEVLESSSEQKNWKGIIIAILVICVVLALIVVAIIIVSPKKTDDEVGEAFTMDEIFSRDFKPRQFDAHWLPDRDVFLYRSSEDELLELDIDSNLTRLVLTNSTFRELNTNVYLPSPDHNYILLAYDIEKVRQKSFRARYKIHNRHAKSHKTRLVSFPHGESMENRKLDLVTWSPNGQSLSFVFERRLYLQSDPFSTPMEVVVQGADDDSSLGIYYGMANPLYEEEILGSSVGHWWSVEATYVCYLAIDDSTLPVHRYPFYGDAQLNDPIIIESPYAKAGATGRGQLSTVKVFVTKASDPSSANVRLSAPDQFKEMDHYVTNVAWADDRHVAIAWLNRIQNVSIIVFCDAETGQCRESLFDTAEDGRNWLSPLPVIRFINNEHTFVTILSKRDGTSGFWKHLALVSVSPSGPGVRVFLTEGLWDVTDVVGYDYSSNDVFYIATNGDPRTRHLFRVSVLNGAGRLNPPVCLTCQISDGCQYVHASFSHSGRHYILHCLGPDVPTYILKSTFDETERIVEDNAKLQTLLSSKALPKKEFYEVNADDGQKFWVQVQLPPALRKEQIYVYPMVVVIDEWPGSQVVTWQHRIDFSTYLASSDNVVVVTADGRGSGGRGDRWRQAIHKRIGSIDLHDQIKAAIYVRDTFNYIDKERVAVFGKSYGGYIATRALGSETNIFRCGVAVTPVTNWKYYNAFTAEKLLGLVENHGNNFKIYNDAQISIKSEHYRSKHLLLVHGTADENVHFQHTAQLAKSLTNAGIDFNVQLYTDASHSLDGVIHHTHHTTTKFLKGYCWNGGKPRQLGKKADVEEGET